MRAHLVRLLLRLLALLPLRLNHALGIALGRIFNAFANDLRDTARTNVGLCFPEWDTTQQRTLVRRCLEETGKATLESGALWLWPAEQVLQRVVKVSGADLLEQGMASGKGVILAVPHLGAWEVVGLYGSQRWPMTSLYRPPRMQGLDELMRKARQRAGATLVPTDASGVRALYKALGRGELVAILPDQDPDRESGVFAPFFGVPANTMTLLPRLVRKTAATVLMTFAERLPKGRGYHLHFMSAPAGLGDADVVMAATQLNAAVESCARQLPAQYQWAYKRFKTRPQSADKIY